MKDKINEIDALLDGRILKLQGLQMAFPPTSPIYLLAENEILFLSDIQLLLMELVDDRD